MQYEHFDNDRNPEYLTIFTINSTYYLISNTSLLERLIDGIFVYYGEFTNKEKALECKEELIASYKYRQSLKVKISENLMTTDTTCKDLEEELHSLAAEVGGLNTIMRKLQKRIQSLEIRLIR